MQFLIFKKSPDGALILLQFPLSFVLRDDDVWVVVSWFWLWGKEREGGKSYLVLYIVRYRFVLDIHTRTDAC